MGPPLSDWKEASCLLPTHSQWVSTLQTLSQKCSGWWEAFHPAFPPRASKPLPMCEAPEGEWFHQLLLLAYTGHYQRPCDKLSLVFCCSELLFACFTEETKAQKAYVMCLTSVS